MTTEPTVVCVPRLDLPAPEVTDTLAVAALM